jgi:hypothetical protein
LQGVEETQNTRIGSQYPDNFGQKWLFFITIELITGVLHGNGAHPFYY